MSEIPEDIRRTARDIMDTACLGEHWVKNGVDAALREDIARAVMAERERCARLGAGDITKDGRHRSMNHQQQ